MATEAVSAPRIYISASYRDQEFATRLAHNLRNALGDDNSVFLDSNRGLQGGDDWLRRLQQEITSRSVYILVLSPDAMASSWTQSEFRLALSQAVSIADKVLIPVLYRPTEVSPFLANYQFVSFVGRPYNAAFAELLAAVQLGQSRQVSAGRVQPWRTEPEIDQDRQAFLAQRTRIAPDVRQGIYPFAGTKLSRADVEWLLASHDDGEGPIDWTKDEDRQRRGLDLRGADLQGVDLRGLPLARLNSGYDIVQAQMALEDAERDEVGQTESLRTMAAMQLQGADLGDAHLEGAQLQGAQLRGARLERCFLFQAHLDNADLRDTQLGSADLTRAHLQGVLLNKAFLAGANLQNTRLEKADLREACLQGANLHAAHAASAFLSGSRLDGADLSEADLKGAFFSEATCAAAIFKLAHLEGANLNQAQLQGRQLPQRDFDQVRRLVTDFPVTLKPADLRGAFLDSATSLEKAKLGSVEFGSVFLADVRWGGVNLFPIDWTSVAVLGDEDAAWNWKPEKFLLPQAGLPRKQRNQLVREHQLQQATARLDVFRAAVSANRQLATALRGQGLNEEADRFAYQAQVLQRQVYRQQGNSLRAAFSRFLDSLAGYGYKPERSLRWYLLTILSFAALYLIFAHLPPQEAVILSLTSFHGRGYPGNFSLGDPIMVIAAIEAIFGLLIEISFIATFTQRFFAR